MGDDKCLDLGLVFDQIGEIRNDIIYSRKCIFREHNTTVYDDDFIMMFDAVHVFTDFT